MSGTADIKFARHGRDKVDVRGLTAAGAAWLSRKRVPDVVTLDVMVGLQMAALTSGLTVEVDCGGRKGIQTVKSIADVMAAHGALTKG